MRFLAGLVLSLALAALCPAQTFSSVGALGHFQSGGGWSTTFYLFNTGNVPAQVHLSFYDDNGSPVAIPVQLPQIPGTLETTAQFGYTLLGNTVLAVATNSADATGTTGWAKLESTGSTVTGYLIFRYEGTSGAGVQEALVTAETRSGQSYVVAFDNTAGHFTAFALANPTNQPVVVTATPRDGLTGAVLGSRQSITVPAMGHLANQLSTVLPYTTTASGTVEFSTPSAGQVVVLGLRFSLPSLAFTSTPPILKQ